MTSLCASCKNKTSNDRCRNNALPGIRFCGIHSRLKTYRIWADVNNVERRTTLISKYWKGYILRKVLRLAGPGVLKRSVCHNEEELLSFEPVRSISPLDYFGFEENEKVYGLDIRTMFDMMNRTLKPINPYTRQPLQMADRKRLRELYGYRTRNKLSIFYDNNKLVGADAILQNRWMQICQIVEENGFYDINPNLFLGLNRTRMYILLTLISNDMKTWAAQHKDTPSKRFLYVMWIRNVQNKFSTTQSANQFSFYVSTILLSMLYNSVEPYSICFIIMSALYRM
jgi:hypothetical protein